jgi:hypothetical protein
VLKEGFLKGNAVSFFFTTKKQATRFLYFPNFK